MPGRRGRSAARRLLVALALVGAGCSGHRLQPVEPFVPALFETVYPAGWPEKEEESRAQFAAGWEALRSLDLARADERFAALAPTSPAGREAVSVSRAVVRLAAGDAAGARGGLAGLARGSPQVALAEAAALHIAGDDEGAWAVLESLAVSRETGRAAETLAARVRPRLLQLRLDRAASHEASGEHAEAATTLARAAALDPSNHALREREGRSWLAAGEPAAAARAFAAAGELEPASVEAWIGLGEARMKAGEAEAARAAFERAAALPGGLERARSFVRALREGGRDRRGGSVEFERAAAAAAVDRAGLAVILAARLPLLRRMERPEAPILLTDVTPSPAREAILELVALGVLEAYDNHTFRPSAPVSRADLARAAAEVLRRLRAAGLLAERRFDVRLLADVSPEHLRYADVVETLRYGVLATDGEGRFRPADPVSGAEALAAADRLAALGR